MSIHAATLEKSSRLRRVLTLLVKRADAGATTLEIDRLANICAVSTAVSELRSCGYEITCDYEGKSEAGAKIYRYRLQVP